MNYIVYKTTNKINGKVYVGVHHTNPDIFDGYIGCGVNHKDSKKKTLKGFPAAVRKYGYNNFVRETLFVYPDSEEGCKMAYEKEAEIVNVEWVKSPKNYNLTIGGKGGWSYTNSKCIAQYTLDGTFIRTWSSITEAETAIGICSISKVLIGKSKTAGNFQWRYYTDEEPIPAVTAKEKTVYQFDLQGNLIKVWKSASEASKQFANSASARTMIADLCNKQSTNQRFGYYWSFKHIFNYNPTTTKTPVACYDNDGVFIESFSSISEAAEAHKCSGGNICAAIKGTQKHCHGYRWRYFYGNTANIKPL